MRGLVRVGAAVPSLALGNVKENMKRHLAMMREAKEKHVSIVTFPELSLTGYTCGDLFFSAAAAGRCDGRAARTKGRNAGGNPCGRRCAAGN